MCPLWSDENLRLFLIFVLKFSTFEEKIEAPLTHVLSPGAFRENMVYIVACQRVGGLRKAALAPGRNKTRAVNHLVRT